MEKSNWSISINFSTINILYTFRLFKQFRAESKHPVPSKEIPTCNPFSIFWNLSTHIIYTWYWCSNFYESFILLLLHSESILGFHKCHPIPKLRHFSKSKYCIQFACMIAKSATLQYLCEYKISSIKWQPYWTIMRGTTQVGYATPVQILIEIVKADKFLVENNNWRLSGNTITK